MMLSASSPSRSGRCPQITSRSSARRCSATSRANSSPCAPGWAAPRRRERSSAIACSTRAASSGASSRARAEGRQAPGEQALSGALVLQQRAQRQQVVAQRIESDRRARRPARSAASAQSSLPPSKARRETRLQKARSSSSWSGVSSSVPPRRRSARKLKRPPGAAAGADPAEGVERDAPVAEQAQRAQQLGEHAAGGVNRPARVLRLAGEQHEHRFTGLGREARSHVGQRPRKRLLAHDLESVRQRQLGRGDGQAT